jgi:hypothetical protein
MAALVDTGFLVALFARDDAHHQSAKDFLRGNPALKLHSIWPVVVEACFFLDAAGKDALLAWLERGALSLHELTLADLGAIRGVLTRYQNLAPDFTDAALVAMASITGFNEIVTVDRRDFSAYRLSDGRPFVRLWLA